MRDKRIIVSTHVGKCAGSTFREILYKLFGFDNVLIDHSSKGGHEIRDPEEWYPKMLSSGMKVVHGHTANIDKWSKVVPDARFVSWIRHPVNRVFSQYYYENRLSGNETLIPPNSDALLLYASENKNQVTELFIPLNRVLDFEFIGLTESFDIHLEVFFNRFCEGRKVEYKKENVNPNGNRYEELVDKNTWMEIERMNEEDMELYYSVKKLWKEGRMSL